MHQALDTRVEEGPLTELAAVFLKLGLIGFGGPAATIAMMEDEVVERRSWMRRETFLDLVGATNLIPGPNAVEMSLHLGLLRAGWRGLLCAGACFTGPAVLMTAGLAWLYVTYGEIPAVAPLLAGIKPAVIAVILGALWRLGRQAIPSWSVAGVAVGVVALLLAGLGEVSALLLGGAVGMVVLRGLRARGMVPVLLAGLLGGSTAHAAVGVPYSLGKLSLFMVKVGSVLFGSGYVLIAFLQDDLVTRWGWLTEQQLLDAVAMGQFTPGPWLSTAAFVGFLLDGWTGAVAAALCIFAPSFVFVVLLRPLVPRLRDNPWSAAFLDSVNAAAVALMAVVSVELGIAVLTDLASWAILAAASVLVLRLKIGAAWIVLFGAAAGSLVATLS